MCLYNKLWTSNFRQEILLDWELRPIDCILLARYFLICFLNLPFHSFSLYHTSASYPSLRNKWPISCQAPTVIIVSKHRRRNDLSVGNLGEQTLNDYSVAEAKIAEKRSRQSNSKYNFMQYVFFEKVYTVYNNWVWGKAPEDGEFSRIIVLKVSWSYRKKLGEQDALVAPPIVLLGPGSRGPRLCVQGRSMVCIHTCVALNCSKLCELVPKSVACVLANSTANFEQATSMERTQSLSNACLSIILYH